MQSDESDEGCKSCGRSYAVRHDHEDETGLCDPCAQAKVVQLERELDEKNDLVGFLRRQIDDLHGAARSASTPNLKVRTTLGDYNGGKELYDVFLGDTFLGRYEQAIATPLANAIGTATGQYNPDRYTPRPSIVTESAPNKESKDG